MKSEYFYPSNISEHLVIATLHSYFYELSELSCSVLISGVAGESVRVQQQRLNSGVVTHHRMTHPACTVDRGQAAAVTII